MATRIYRPYSNSRPKNIKISVGFRATLQLGREYLWNRQSENGIANCDNSCICMLLNSVNLMQNGEN